MITLPIEPLPSLAVLEQVALQKGTDPDAAEIVLRYQSRTGTRHSLALPFPEAMKLLAWLEQARRDNPVHMP
jgi:hypothetical protein